MRYVAPLVRLGIVALHAVVHSPTLTLVSTSFAVLTAVTL